MSALIDIAGRRFGRLEVISLIESSNQRRFWQCKCDCGVEKIVEGHSLRRGKVLSCGCLLRETTRDRSRTHGLTKSRTHVIWVAMKQRCTNPKTKRYDLYGGRGITVCDRWMHSFENFLADMGEVPDGLSLDRFPDVDGNYEPGNCRWATDVEQVYNRRVISNAGIHNISWQQSLKRWRVRIRREGAYVVNRVFDDFFEACCIVKSFVAKEGSHV